MRRRLPTAPISGRAEKRHTALLIRDCDGTLEAALSRRAREPKERIEGDRADDGDEDGDGESFDDCAAGELERGCAGNTSRSREIRGTAVRTATVSARVGN